MFSMKKGNVNLQDVKSGQTLFSFLRKKKLNGHTTSFQPHQQNSINQEQYSHTKENNAYLERKENINSTATKIVTFADAEDEKPYVGKKLLTMISPFQKSSLQNSQQITQSLIKPILKHKKAQENFPRKKRRNLPKKLKDSLQNTIDSGKNIKSKGQNLITQLKPLLKLIEQKKENRNISRRAQDARVQICSFEHILKGFNLDSISQTIESLGDLIGQEVQNAQIQIREQYELKIQQKVRRKEEQKEKVVNRLINEKGQLENKLFELERELEKSELEKQKLVEKYSELHDEKAQLLEQELLEYEAEIQRLNKKLYQSENQRKSMYDEYVQISNAKSQLEIQVRQSEQPSKEEFLKKQLTTLRNQFKSEINELIKLNNSKETEQNYVISELKKQMSELNGQINSDRKLSTREDDQWKIQAIKYKKQNECLLADMQRLNEELFQHWQALKEIKRIAVRKEILCNFLRVYKDLCFNDLLFD